MTLAAISSGDMEGFLRPCARLSAWFAVGLAIIAPCGALLYGTPGVQAALAAALVNYLAGVLALAMACPFQGTANFALVGMLGMLVRMGLPLAYIVVLALRGGWIADAGGIAMAAAFYALALVAETMILVGLVHRNDRPGRR